MDTAQWPQERVTYTCLKPQGNDLDKKARPQKEQAQNCPRCNSTNTKFCYYNNYSLTQPRFFCKACRRYWTKGGSLRSIPVGGGSRKNKRPLTNSLNSNSSSKKLYLHDHHQNPRNPDGQDLNLGFPSSSSSQPLKSFSDMIQSQNQITSPNASTSPSQQLSALELLTGFSSRGLGNGFMPIPVHHQDPNSGYGQGLGFPLHDFKPTLSFSMDGLGSGYGSLQESVNGRLLFPFEDIKPQQQEQVSSTGDDDHQKESNTNGDSTGYWTGMLGGGGSW